MSQYEYTISLRFHHPNIDPDIITRNIGIKPSNTCKVGEPRVTPSGRPLKGFEEESFWVANLNSSGWLNSDDIEIEKFIENSIKELDSKRLFINNIILDGGEVEYFIGISSENAFGLSLNIELIKSLSDIGISLEVCIYPEAEITIEDYVAT